MAFEDGTYPGDYLVPVGAALKAKVGDAYLGKDEGEWLVPIRDYATDAMMDLIREDLALLGVEMDVFYSEKSLYGTGRIEAAIEDLKGKGLIYEGTLEPPKGKTPEDWEPRGPDAVQIHRIRRRRRPPGDEIRRLLDLFRARHRLITTTR